MNLLEVTEWCQTRWEQNERATAGSSLKSTTPSGHLRPHVCHVFAPAVLYLPSAVHNPLRLGLIPEPLRRFRFTASQRRKSVAAPYCGRSIWTSSFSGDPPPTLATRQFPTRNRAGQNRPTLQPAFTFTMNPVDGRCQERSFSLNVDSSQNREEELETLTKWSRAEYAGGVLGVSPA